MSVPPIWKPSPCSLVVTRYKWMVTAMWPGVFWESLCVSFWTVTPLIFFKSVLKDLEFWNHFKWLEIPQEAIKQKTEVDEDWWLTLLSLRRHFGDIGKSRRCLFSWSCFSGVTTSFPPDVMAAWSTLQVMSQAWGLLEYISSPLSISPWVWKLSNWNHHLQVCAKNRRKVVDVIFEPGALYEEGSGISAKIPWMFWARGWASER